MKLPPDTPLEDALRLAMKQGHYIFCLEGCPSRPDLEDDSSRILEWMNHVKEYQMNSAKPEQIENKVSEISITACLAHLFAQMNAYIVLDMTVLYRLFELLTEFCFLV